MEDWFQCSETGDFVQARYGWKFCPFCGTELKPRKYLIPETHEVVTDRRQDTLPSYVIVDKNDRLRR